MISLFAWPIRANVLVRTIERAYSEELLSRNEFLQLIARTQTINMFRKAVLKAFRRGRRRISGARLVDMDSLSARKEIYRHIDHGLHGLDEEEIRGFLDLPDTMLDPVLAEVLGATMLPHG